MAAAASDAPAHAQAVRATRQLLDTFDDTSLVSLTRLGIAEVRALKQEVAEIFPASNLPSFLLQGLLQLEDRTIRQERVAADLRVLFRGSAQLGLYSAFLVAPATILYGYQKLLALAGKDVDSAFPDGVWQFYTEFGMREDAARHTIETIGFPLGASGVIPLDAATCWVYAALHTLHSYDALLANEWDEKVLLRVLDQVLHARAVAALGRKLPRRAAERDLAIAAQVAALQRRYHLTQIAAHWQRQRPYQRPATASEPDFASFRRASFRRYCEQALRELPADLRAEIVAQVAARRAAELPRYHQQLALAITLQPETHREHRVLLPLHMAKIAFIAGGRYHLIDACARDAHGMPLVFSDATTPEAGTALALRRADDGSLRDRYGNLVVIDHAGWVAVAQQRLGRLRPPPLATIKAQLGALLAQPAHLPDDLAATDLLLATAPRAQQAELRALLPDATKRALVALQCAPVMINWDAQASAMPLAALRRTQRGCGDHAMTLLRTDRTMVFDLSHIFCDAAWGIALAEIMTGFATALLPAVRAIHAPAATAPAPLKLAAPAAFRTAALAQAARMPPECTAENAAIELDDLNRLRRRLAGVDLVLTVNDLLLLARAAHAAAYRPGAAAEGALATIADLPDGVSLVRQIRHALDAQRLVNPSLLIPMDATAADPRLRLYPATFRNPLPDLLPRLDHCDALVRSLRRMATPADLRTFEHERQALYRDLAIFANLLRALKHVTMRGESFSTAALRLMGHLPGAMQHLVDMIPQKVGMLNEILKGREVFSNVGRVAPASSVTRFASARDDGDTKLLVWGIVTDASGRLVVTLRDFRPHVAPLMHQGQGDLAQALTQEYLDTYATCTNDLVTRIQRVLSHK